MFRAYQKFSNLAPHGKINLSMEMMLNITHSQYGAEKTQHVLALFNIIVEKLARLTMVDLVQVYKKR